MTRKSTKENCLANKYPEISKEWCQRLNGDSTIYNTPPKSNKRAWWKCSNCNEYYNAIISNRTSGRACPYCSGQRVCERNCLSTKRPDIAKEWHPTLNGTLHPKDVTNKSGKSVWWICGDCKEVWKTIICDRTGPRNAACPYCSGRKVCNWNCLATQCPEISKQWHPTRNGNITPHDVVTGSKRKFWWVCLYCRKDVLKSCYQATQINKKTIICSECNLYYQEEQVRSILEKLTGKKFPKTRNIPWFLNSKTNRKYEADGYCQELNMMFEHQGPQHCCVYKRYHPKGIQDFFYQLYKDADKYRLCKENNCHLICTYNQVPEEIEQNIRNFLIDNHIHLM